MHKSGSKCFITSIYNAAMFRTWPMLTLTVVLQVVVTVFLQIISMELVQIVPLPHSLEEDVDMTNVLNSMTNSNRV